MRMYDIIKKKKEGGKLSREEIDFFEVRNRENGYRAGNNTAVNSKTAFSYIENVGQGMVMLDFRKYVIKSCSEYSDRNSVYNVVEDVVKNYAYFLRAPYCINNGSYHTAGNYKRIPCYRDAENSERYAVNGKFSDTEPRE